jgi:hypothetical protein
MMERIQEYARRIAASTLVANEAASSPVFKRKDSSPSKAASSHGKPQRQRAPILNDRQMAQQSTLTSFFNSISATAESLKSLQQRTSQPAADGIALFSDQVEDSIRELEEQGLCELAAHDLLLEQRRTHESTASRFMAEAHNVHSGQHSDSNASQDLSERSSDRDFVTSQGTDIEDATNPRFVQARNEIRKAGKDSKAAEVSAVNQVKNLPAGFCSKGHLFEFAPTLRKGRSVTCSFCQHKYSEGVYNCTCYTYICIHCLVGNKADNRPPLCPKLDCGGSCHQRWKPLVTSCFQGKHDIPREERFWMCSERRCQAIICLKCASTTNDVNQPRNLQAAAPLIHPAPTSVSSSSTAARLMPTGRTPDAQSKQ